MIVSWTALIVDTFREAMARWLFWGLFGISTLLIIFFLFILKIDAVEGAVSLMGLIPLREASTGDIVKIVKGAYGFISAFLFTFGTFLSIFASAGLVPSVLEPGRIELLLSKPITRAALFLGRYIGNVLVVSCNIIYLIAGIWTILGVKTGIWDTHFLLGIFTTIFIFSVLLTVVFLVGVTFESAALSVMVTVALMIVSVILAARTPMMRLLSSEWSRDLWQALYWVFPKVFEIGGITFELIQGRQVESYAPIWSSAMFAIAILFLSVRIFQRRDF